MLNSKITQPQGFGIRTVGGLLLLAMRGQPCSVCITSRFQHFEPRPLLVDDNPADRMVGGELNANERIVLLLRQSQNSNQNSSPQGFSGYGSLRYCRRLKNDWVSC